nr:hypothetical protein [Micromonospora sp. DSM 115978]
MLAVPLTDPLWWVTRRLRKFLTGLMMLALAFGAGATLAGGPAAGDSTAPPRPAGLVTAVAIDSGVLFDPIATRDTSNTTDRTAANAEHTEDDAYPVGTLVAGFAPAIRPVGTPFAALADPPPAGAPAGLLGQRAPPRR